MACWRKESLWLMVRYGELYFRCRSESFVFKHYPFEKSLQHAAVFRKLPGKAVEHGDRLFLVVGIIVVGGVSDICPSRRCFSCYARGMLVDEVFPTFVGFLSRGAVGLIEMT